MPPLQIHIVGDGERTGGVLSLPPEIAGEVHHRLDRRGPVGGVAAGEGHGRHMGRTGLRGGGVQERRQRLGDGGESLRTVQALCPEAGVGPPGPGLADGKGAADEACAVSVADGREGETVSRAGLDMARKARSRLLGHRAVEGEVEDAASLDRLGRQLQGRGLAGARQREDAQGLAGGHRVDDGILLGGGCGRGGRPRRRGRGSWHGIRPFWRSCPEANAFRGRSPGPGYEAYDGSGVDAMACGCAVNHSSGVRVSTLRWPT